MGTVRLGLLLSAVVLAWDHDGAGVVRWILVIDGVERDVTALVVDRGPSQPARYGDEPCDGCRVFEVSLPDLVLPAVVTAKACSETACSPESRPLPARRPSEVTLR